MAVSRERFTRFWRENWLFLLIVGAIVVGFLALRTPASAAASVAEVDALLSAGQPTLVEFYSNT
jgi:glutamate 5-kinase